MLSTFFYKFNIKINTIELHITLLDNLLFFYQLYSWLWNDIAFIQIISLNIQEYDITRKLIISDYNFDLVLCSYKIQWCHRRFCSLYKEMASSIDSDWTWNASFYKIHIIFCSPSIKGLAMHPTIVFLSNITIAILFSLFRCCFI